MNNQREKLQIYIISEEIKQIEVKKLKNSRENKKEIKFEKKYNNSRSKKLEISIPLGKS